jgi:hypothetical protein
VVRRPRYRLVEYEQHRRQFFLFWYVQYIYIIWEKGGSTNKKKNEQINKKTILIFIRGGNVSPYSHAAATVTLDNFQGNLLINDVSLGIQKLITKKK